MWSEAPKITLVLMRGEDLATAMLEDNTAMLEDGIMTQVTPGLPSPSGILNVCDVKHIYNPFLETQMLLKNLYLWREALM